SLPADECTKAAASRRIERYSQCSGTFLQAYVSCDGESSGQRRKIPPSTNTGRELRSRTPVMSTSHAERSLPGLLLRGKGTAHHRHHRIDPFGSEGARMREPGRHGAQHHIGGHLHIRI